MLTTLRNKRILLTGAGGFLGKHIMRVLGEYADSALVRGVSRSTHLYGQATTGYDLTNVDEVHRMFAIHQPHLVFHVAGFNGGIETNRTFSADIFYRNTVMGLNVLNEARKVDVQKIVSIVASCAYPCIDRDGWVAQVMNETDFCGSEPHSSVACHGYAKRNLQLGSSFFNKQYGLKAVCVCPTTVFGQGDSFDPTRTKVMGALIKKFVDAAKAEKKSVTLWGTGEAKREFLYVEDAAKLVVQSMIHYEESDTPLNLGSGHEISIKELAWKIANAVGYGGEILWDTSKPDGQMRKRLDLTRQVETLPKMELTSLDEGIKRTVAHYRSLCSPS